MMYGFVSSSSVASLVQVGFQTVGLNPVLSGRALYPETEDLIKTRQEAINPLLQDIKNPSHLSYAWAEAFFGQTVHWHRLSLNPLVVTEKIDTGKTLSPDQERLQALVETGLRHKHEKQWEAAAKCFEQVASQYFRYDGLPDYPISQILMHLGSCRVSLDQLEEAKESFEKAVVTDRSNLPALLALGRIHYQLGDYQEALADFTDIMRIGAKLTREATADVPVMHVILKAAESLSDTQAKLGYLDAACDGYEMVINELERIRRTAVSGQDVAAIRKQLARVYVKLGRNIISLAKESKTALDSDRLHQVIESFARAIELGLPVEELIDVFALSSSVHQYLGDYDKALRDINVAILFINQYGADVYQGDTRAYRRAVAYFNRALLSKRIGLQAHIDVALLLSAKEDLEIALEGLHEGLREDELRQAIHEVMASLNEVIKLSLN